MEFKLINRFGYKKIKAVPDDILVFMKDPDAKKGTSVVIKNGLTLDRESELMERCDRIVDFFPDPYQAIMAVRQRLFTMSTSLTVDEKQFVLDYAEENFPEEAAISNKKA